VPPKTLQNGNSSWRGLHKLLGHRIKSVIMHLICPHVDGMAFLRGTHVFALELEGDDIVIGKVGNGYELVTQTQNLYPYLKEIHQETLKPIVSSTNYSKRVTFRENKLSPRKLEMSYSNMD
jgi:hypothetical protein